MKNPKLVSISMPILIGLALVGCSKSDKGTDDAITAPEKSSPRDDTIEVRIQWPIGDSYARRFMLTEQNRLQFPGRPNPLVEQVRLTQGIESHVEQTVDLTMIMEIHQVGAKGGGTRTMANHLTQTMQSSLLKIGEDSL